VAVGGTDEIDQWRGRDTIVIDAEARRVVPGFNDAHVHFVDGGAQLDQVDLTDADTPAEFTRRIAERAKSRPGDWILGGNWDAQRWTPSRLPTRHMIDNVTNGTPVFVRHRDGHSALANSTVLGRAGITELTPDPPGGTIVRDEDGMPTGVLEDRAMAFVTRVIPAVTREQRLRAVKRALAHAASLGVTSVQDMNASYEDLAVYAELAGRRELTTRMYAAPAEAGWYDQAKLGVRRAFGSPWFRIGAVHAFADGSQLSGPPSEELPPLDQMRTRLMAADHAGLQLCIHASSGAGVSQILDLYESIARANGDRDRRFRVEHGHPLTANDIERVAGLKLIASVQPSRATSYDFRALLNQRVRLALGTDWDAAPLNPMSTLGAAVAAQLTIQEAVSAYTSGSAFAEFQEAEKGTIARGKLADLVILSDDIFGLPPAGVSAVKVLTTIAGGKVVHQRRP